MTGVSIDSLTAGNLSELELFNEADETNLGDCPYLARYESLPGHDPNAVCGYGCVDEPQCVTCCPKEGWPAIQWLVPILGGVAPICSTCGGSGKLTADEIEQFDQAAADLARSYDQEEWGCAYCNGSGVPTSIVLTVECATCGGDGKSDWCGYGTGLSLSWAPCPKCISGQRSVAKSRVLQVLPIVAEMQWTPEMQHHPAVVIGDVTKKRPFADWPDLLLYTEEDGSEKWGIGVDISALLPLASWETSKWALLVKDLVIE